MAKNYMADVAKMLGVEHGEEFNLKDCSREVVCTHRFKLTMGGLCEFWDNTWVCHDMIGDLLTGEYEIVKLPWKPKFGDEYYCASVPQRCIRKCFWSNITRDYAFYKLGMCYRTKEEAEEHFAKDYKELMGKGLEEWM